ncbi:MAG: hypothetical protein LW835_16130 [Burkholderiaceae bacterium]|nr:hypothetical protein [Burkholderiaceae bacterium]
MPRKPSTSVPAPLPVEVIDDAHALQAAGSDGAMVIAAMQEAGAAGILVGRYQMARAMANLSRVAMLRAYDQLKTSGAYKGLYLQDELGNSIRADTLESFCLLAFDRSYRSMEEDLQNLSDLGDALYESAQTLCLRYSDMRALRALPAPERAKIEAAIGGGAADGKAIRALISDLVEDLTASRRQADATAAKLNELDEVVSSQAADLTAAKKEIKSLKAFVPSDEAEAQSVHDAVQIEAVKRALDEILKPTSLIGQVLLDARTDPRVSVACVQQISGLVDSELRRWYSYADLATAALGAKK